MDKHNESYTDNLPIMQHILNQTQQPKQNSNQQYAESNDYRKNVKKRGFSLLFLKFQYTNDKIMNKAFQNLISKGYSLFQQQ